jgi:hypothetical protein
MIKTNYITVTEFKDFNPEVDFGNTADATVSGVIQRASERVDSFLQYSLIAEDISQEVNPGIVTPEGNLMIFTKKRPINSLSALDLKLGTTVIELSLTDGNGENRFDKDADQKYILYPYQEINTTGTVSIRNFFDLRNHEFFTRTSYNAGYSFADLPNDIKDAVNLLSKDIWNRQTNSDDLVSMSQGAVSKGYRNRKDGKTGLQIEAESILRRYRRVV